MFVTVSVEYRNVMFFSLFKKFNKNIQKAIVLYYIAIHFYLYYIETSITVETIIIWFLFNIFRAKPKPLIFWWVGVMTVEYTMKNGMPFFFKKYYESPHFKGSSRNQGVCDHYPSQLPPQEVHRRTIWPFYSFTRMYEDSLISNE